MKVLKYSHEALKRMFDINRGTGKSVKDIEAGVLAIDLWLPRDLETFSEEDKEVFLADGYLSRSQINDAIERMKSDGDLVEYESSDQSSDAKRTCSLAHLEAISRMSFQLAHELSGFGDYDGVYQKMPDNGTEPLERELHDISRYLRSQLMRLKELRNVYLAEQMKTLELEGKSNLRLHLGAGPSKIPGWVNIDVAPAEFSMNMVWDFPFGNESVECIYFAHLFEHLHFKGESKKMLVEACRVLKKGGVIRLVVPDTKVLVKAYLNNDEEFFEERKQYWPFTALVKQPLEPVLRYSGAGVRPGDFFRHKWGYDFQLLHDLLLEAGFSKVVRKSHMESDHPDLKLDDHSSAAGLKIKGEPLSLFVEAHK